MCCGKLYGHFLFSDLMQPSEVRIGFEEAEYTAFENSTLFVTIELVSGADFPPIDLFLTTQDGTATGIMLWAERARHSQFMTIEICEACQYYFILASTCPQLV